MPLNGSDIRENEIRNIERAIEAGELPPEMQAVAEARARELQQQIEAERGESPMPEEEQRRQFKESIKKGEIPEGSKFIGGTTGFSYIPKEQWEGVEKFGKDVVIRGEALRSLEKYRDKEGYDIAKAVAEGKITEVRKAGFTEEHIRQATGQHEPAGPGGPVEEEITRTEYGRGLYAVVPTLKIGGLEKPGQIRDIQREFENLPRDDKKIIVAALTGQVVTTSARELPDVPWDKLNRTEQLRVLAYYNDLKTNPIKVMGKPVASPVQQAYFITSGVATKAAVGLVAGTAVYWKEMSGYERAASIALDALIVAQMARLPRLFGIMAKGSRASVEAAEMVKAGRRAERATLRAVSPKSVVKAYDEYTRATDKLAEHLFEIKRTEKQIATRPGGPVNEDVVSLERLNKETAIYEKALEEVGNKFGKAQAAAKAKQVVKVEARGIEGERISIRGTGKPAYDIPDTMKNFGKESVRGVRDAVDNAFGSSIPSLRVLNRRYTAATRDMVMAVHDKNAAEIGRLKLKLADIEYQTKIAKSGQLVKLTEARVRLYDKIKEVEKARKYPHGKAEAKVLEKKLKSLRLADRKLAGQIEEAFKYQQIEWAEPIRRGGGGVRVGKPYTPIKAGGGGGARMEVESPVLYAGAPVRMAKEGEIVMGKAGGPDKEQYITITTVEDIPGRETIPVDPQPYWIGEVEVEEPQVKPATKPSEKPKPGEIVWTPPLILSPRPQPIVTIIAKTDAKALSQTQAAALQRAVNKYLVEIRSGASPKAAAKAATRMFPAVKVNPLTKSQTRMQISVEAKPQTRTKSAQETGPKTQPKIGLRTSLKTSAVTEKTPKKLPPKLLKGKTSRPLTATADRVLIGWKQGFGYWVVRQDGSSLFTKEKPENLRLIDFKALKPKHTIQTIEGEGEKVKTTADLGIMDLKIDRPSRRPGRPGALSFAGDPGQHSKSHIKLGLKSTKEGRQYRTRVPGDNLISRRPLGRT